MARFRRICFFCAVLGFAPILFHCEYLVDTRERNRQECGSRLFGVASGLELLKRPTLSQADREVVNALIAALAIGTVNCLDKVDAQVKPIYK